MLVMSSSAITISKFCENLCDCILIINFKFLKPCIVANTKNNFDWLQYNDETLVAYMINWKPYKHACASCTSDFRFPRGKDPLVLSYT